MNKRKLEWGITTWIGLAAAMFFGPGWELHAQGENQPPPGRRYNVLMIAVDDLNDWVGCLQGHPQTKTPHMDRLAARGVLFANAHCQTPLCNPSRVSVMTGVLPSTTGVYANLPTSPTETEPPAHYWERGKYVTMPEYFARHGYRTLGAGKMFHQCKWTGLWDDYGVRGGFGIPGFNRRIQNVAPARISIGARRRSATSRRSMPKWPTMASHSSAKRTTGRFFCRWDSSGRMCRCMRRRNGST